MLCASLEEAMAETLIGVARSTTNSETTQIHFAANILNKQSPEDRDPAVVAAFRLARKHHLQGIYEDI